MGNDRRPATMRRTTATGALALAVVLLAGCAAEISGVDAAQARVTAKEKAVAEAETAAADASAEFCRASEDYVRALDRYGDVLNAGAPTVGDVRVAGADLVEPHDEAVSSAEAAADAQQDLVTAQQELAEAQAALAALETDPAAADAGEAPLPEPTPLAPAASVDRVTQAEADFAQAQDGIGDGTPLVDAAEQFNSAAVALEMAWLVLFADAGCLADEQQAQAVAAARAYTSALQQDLTTAGYYGGAIDGVYGPLTTQAVEDLQQTAGLPVTGTVDKATAEALQSELVAQGETAAQDAVASTAAVQQTLKLAGFWDGPVDGVWTPELTEAVKELQVELGVEPTGAVDAATVLAFQEALSELERVEPAPSPTTEDGEDG